MRYKINSAVAYTRKMKTKIFFRWFFYFLALFILYSIMSCGIFELWQPYFIISLAIAVSMREQEFASSIFGIICGFMLDISVGTLFGFYAVWLMPCCFLTSLLVKNLIKVNFLNHIIFTAVTTLFSFSMFFLFNYVIWNTPGREIIVTKILLPSFIATFVSAPLIYFIVKPIARKLGLEDNVDLNEAMEDIVEKREEKENK
ncbi:MAG TPA: rod shape-determining protein MreD [Ruminococcaceae bacterium]|nr:rod shape-determining protein MreD [Oscillospiraceae bacterium]